MAAGEAEDVMMADGFIADRVAACPSSMTTYAVACSEPAAVAEMPAADLERGAAATLNGDSGMLGTAMSTADWAAVFAAHGSIETCLMSSRSTPPRPSDVPLLYDPFGAGPTPCCADK